MIVTLFEAIALVVAVMFLFLQNWRTTLIPAITIPVVLLGTFGVLAAFGYTINTLTMFALVLAIGLLVDDAIVVVENVERIMSEEGLSPHDATVKSMGEITSALIGIALVLSAVFLPMAFFGGSTGVIYRQFSVTIVSAMVLSIIVALVLTPTLCSTLLTPAAQGGELHGRFFTLVQSQLRPRHCRATTAILRRGAGPAAASRLMVYAVIVAVLALLFFRLPTGFLPQEDQGVHHGAVSRCRAGAEQSRTLAVGKQVEHYFLVDEKKNVENMFIVTGFSFSGSGQNAGMAFIHLKNWSERSGYANSAQAIAQRAMRHAFQDPRCTGLRAHPAIRARTSAARRASISNSKTAAMSATGRLSPRSTKLLAMAARDPVLQAVRPNGLPDTPQLHVDVDNAKATALGLSLSSH